MKSETLNPTVVSEFPLDYRFQLYTRYDYTGNVAQFPTFKYLDRR